MKVGDYVRTDIGEIRKVVRVTDDLYILDKDVVFAHKDKIKKISPNIIDLIEVKDIIKFQCISDEYDFEYKEQYINQINNNDDLESFKEAVENEDLKLISIVTHEMFESMEYKVGD